MLKHLHLENFKSWSAASLELAPLTGLFGANSSGKSSLLQFLLLLKQTKDTSDRAAVLDFGSPDADANLGSFRDAVRGHKAELPIRWRLDWELPSKLSIPDPAGKRSEALFDGSIVSVESEVRSRGRTIFTEFLTYGFANATFSVRREAERSGYKLEAEDPKNFQFVRTQGRVWDLPTPTKSYLFPDQARTYFQNSGFIGEFETAYAQQMDKIIHLGPLREFPRREYAWSGSTPTDVGQRGERTIDAILAAVERKETRNLGWKKRKKPFEEMIAWWLSEMRMIESFHVEEVAPQSGLYRVNVQKDRASPQVLLTDVGFGISQVLPALVLLYYVPEGSTVVLEQPEIHLHPAVQTMLADVIISAIKGRRIQVILESHSEYLLNRLLRRLAEGDAAPIAPITRDEVKLYFCKNALGQSTLNELNINLFGAIENWPDDFFGDSFGEIAAREEAALKKKRAGVTS